MDSWDERLHTLQELCSGEDTLGGYYLMLIESLDTLTLMGDLEPFTTSVDEEGQG